MVHTNDEIRTLTRHACRNGMTSPEVGRNLATSEPTSEFGRICHSEPATAIRIPILGDALSLQCDLGRRKKRLFQSSSRISFAGMERPTDFSAPPPGVFESNDGPTGFSGQKRDAGGAFVSSYRKGAKPNVYPLRRSCASSNSYSDDERTTITSRSMKVGWVFCRNLSSFTNFGNPIPMLAGQTSGLEEGVGVEGSIPTIPA